MVKASFADSRPWSCDIPAITTVVQLPRTRGFIVQQAKRANPSVLCWALMKNE